LWAKVKTKAKSVNKHSEIMARLMHKLDLTTIIAVVLTLSSVYSYHVNGHATHALGGSRLQRQHQGQALSSRASIDPATFDRYYTAIPHIVQGGHVDDDAGVHARAREILAKQAIDRVQREAAARQKWLGYRFASLDEDDQKAIAAAKELLPAAHKYTVNPRFVEKQHIDDQTLDEEDLEEQEERVEDKQDAADNVDNESDDTARDSENDPNRKSDDEGDQKNVDDADSDAPELAQKKAAKSQVQMKNAQGSSEDDSIETDSVRKEFESVSQEIQKILPCKGSDCDRLRTNNYFGEMDLNKRLSVAEKARKQAESIEHTLAASARLAARQAGDMACRMNNAQAQVRKLVAKQGIASLKHVDVGASTSKC
jgi:hypothetical protein